LNCAVLGIVFVDCVVPCIVSLLIRTVLMPPGVYPIAVKYITSYDSQLLLQVTYIYVFYACLRITLDYFRKQH